MLNHVKFCVLWTFSFTILHFFFFWEQIGVRSRNYWFGSFGILELMRPKFAVESFDWKNNVFGKHCHRDSVKSWKSWLLYLMLNKRLRWKQWILSFKSCRRCWGQYLEWDIFPRIIEKVKEDACVCVCKLRVCCI